jgi:hypothetical protein
MGGKSKAITAVLVLALSAGMGYFLLVEKQRRDQRQNVVRLLGDTTAHLRTALNGAAAPELVARIDSNLKLAKAPRQPELAMAAEQYIHGAREIVRRRSDAERLAREAAMSRRALTMHMAVAHQRDTYWIRVASDLKKRVERDHHDLDVSLKALTHLLDELPATRKELAPHIDASLLLEEEERRKAHAHAEQAAQRAAAELAKIRRLAEPR